MAVDPLFAQWLQADGDYALRETAGASALWGASGLTTERLTGIATEAAAQAEGDRQLAFFERGPFAIDVHDVIGTDWQEQLGTVITLTVKQLGYDAGQDVFLIGVDADRSTGITALTVLRPLRGLS
ncbi:hypothetical protein [Sphingomonas sp.]|uniref:hypothetical protein n=1 Tax=Sphingomonas sp. TaxID=28214 RepID=UPI000DB6FB58|nr:hypothetical protein [Sphingomonas sp.]PZU10918.1 MAG: hypothetical protein DI605_04690 [Sphingomonas sp.]